MSTWHPSQEPALTVERNFLGTSWNFVVRKDGSAYWLNTRTGTQVESTRSA